MSVFRLPDLGEGLRDAEIVTWHVVPGDHVVADQPLVSVETAKAVVEIPSPQSGHIATLCGEPGDVVEIGAPLVEFKDQADVTDKAAIVGELPKAQKTQPASGTRRDRKAAPAVRAQAKKLGVELADINGTGPDGSISLDDVKHAAAAKASGARIERVRGVRRAMAQNMSRSGAEVVPATVMDSANIDHWPKSADPTIRLISAMVAACKAEPSLNAWYDAHSGERWLHERIDLGIAMDTPDGLFVPVLRDVANRTTSDRRKGLEAMKKDIRARAVPPEELTGQTITLSNFGMFGGRHVALVVLPPQVAILGAGRLERQVVPVAGKAEICRILPLSLTFDHRVVTGGEAARFIAAVIEDLERVDGDTASVGKTTAR
jgi:pyruvate dehydrogenase E2 component (dihydrolipoamide acetyltransferase)